MNEKPIISQIKAAKFKQKKLLKTLKRLLKAIKKRHANS